MKVARQVISLFLVLASPLAYGQKASEATSLSNSETLEIHLTKSPFWKNNCLWLSIGRVNHSKSPIFLPSFEGILINLSVTDPTNALGRGSGEVWLPVYGPGDAISSDVTRLAPGKAKQDTYCLADTFPVVDSEKKTQRHVPLQGKLRLYASYYLKDPNRQIGRQKSEEAIKPPPSGGKNADRGDGGRIMIEIPIPCPDGVDKAECTTPPPIFAGECLVAFPFCPPVPPRLPPD
jgi:hypothetical protein